MTILRLLAFALAGALGCLPPAVLAQGAPPAQAMSQDQLDGLLAPIALYPDELLTQVLIAATYPLEVVEAARFVKQNPTLRGQALEDALKDRAWDPSVLSLTAFPQVLDMMNDKLEWTQRLGDAFLADEAGVMRTVQSLRQRAVQAGNLNSNEQQRVVVQEKIIVIEPAQPQYVYVPVYNPTIIFGPWWAPAYRPWYWYPPPIWGYPPAPPSWGFTAGFFWGSAWAVNYNNWGWARPNWGRNNINININNNYWFNRPQYRDRYPGGSGNWSHAPEHRRGVAYRDPAVGNKYRPTNPAHIESRQNYRGKDPMPSTRPGGPSTVERPAAGTTANLTAGQPAARPGAPSTMDRPTSRPSPGASTGQPTTRPAPGASTGQPTTLPSTGQSTARPSAGPSTGQPTARPGGPSPTDRAAVRPMSPQPATRPAPTFQPQSRPQVQAESQRGQSSRQTMNAPSPSAGRPAPASGAPAGHATPHAR